MLPDYRIFETENFSRDIEKITKGGSTKVKQKLRTYIYPQLQEEPHYGINIRKLKNWEPDTWRYRVGEWRFFYEIEEQDKVVCMIAAHHRKEAYG